MDGILDGSMALFGADADHESESFSAAGLMFAFLSVTDPTVMTAWFRHLAEDGIIVDDLQLRPWGDSDGQVRDRYGMLWLIGFPPQK